MLCEDKCIDMILDDMELLGQQAMEANLTGIKNLPLIRLQWMMTRINQTRRGVFQYQTLIGGGQHVMHNVTFNFDLETLADILYLKAKDIESKGVAAIGKAVKAAVDAEELLDFIHDLLDEMNRIIDNLRRYGYNVQGAGYVATDRMLLEAERILRELQHRNFLPNIDGGERELRKAKHLLDKVRALVTSPGITNDLRERLERLRRLLSDVINVVQEKVQQPTLTSLRLVQEGRDLYVYVTEAIHNSTMYANHANGSVEEARRLIELAKNALIEAAVQFGLVPRLKDELENATQQLEHRRSILARLNPEYEDKYVK